MAEPSIKDEPERRLWPWVLLALLLAAGIALFFVYAPRHSAEQPVPTASANGQHPDSNGSAVSVTGTVNAAID